MAHTPGPWTFYELKSRDESSTDGLGYIRTVPEDGLEIALTAIRPIVADHIAELLRAYCIIGVDSRPIRETLDPDEEDEVAAEEAALALIDAALAKAGAAP